MKKILSVALLSMAVLIGCDKDDSLNESLEKNSKISKSKKRKGLDLQNHSITPNFLDLKPGFKNLKITTLLSSEDVLPNTPEFIYGSMADGAGLLKNGDDTYSLINNIEADFSIARITLDETFKPVGGEYIVNAVATGHNAQCSGSLNTIEEHGFLTYFSGGEWLSDTPGVFNVNPYKDSSTASTAEKFTAMGQWVTENAVTANKMAFPGKTVVVIGDDQSNNIIPSGQVGLYVGNQGDLYGGKLYGLKVPGRALEMELSEGETAEVEFVELQERELDLLDAECKQKGVMGFSRVEDLDWRKGTAANNRELIFAVTGRPRASLIGLGSQFGRIYHVVFDENNPLKGKITCLLDADIPNGKARELLSPDNIMVTENYVYIQEDPNVNPANLGEFPSKQHFAQLYEYNLKSRNLKTILEIDQEKAEQLGYGTTDRTWEITGMIDVSDIIGVRGSSILITQNHGWGDSFTDPDAMVQESGAPFMTGEGSQLYLVQGLK